MGTLGNERAGATVLPFQALFEREMSALLELARARGVDRDPVVRQRLARAWGGLRILQLNNDRLLSTVLQGGASGAGVLDRQAVLGELAPRLRRADDRRARRRRARHPRERPPEAAMQHSFLNSRAETIYGGANEIQRNILGERVLGLPKE